MNDDCAQEKNCPKKTKIRKEKKKTTDKDKEQILQERVVYRERKLNAKRIIQEEKEKCRKEFTRKLEEDSLGHKKLLYRVINNMRKANDTTTAIETEEENIGISTR